MKANNNNLCMGKYGKTIEIKITNVCNAQCDFCIEKDGHTPQQADVKTLIDATNSLEDYKNVLILGGEPFMYPHLVEYINGLENKEKIFITTNGLGKYFTEETIRAIANKVTAINISMHHYTPDKNAEVYKVYEKDNFNAVQFNNIKNMIEILHEYNIPVRINCNLFKGFLDNTETVEKMIRFASTYLKADEIRFAELQNTTIENGFVFAKDAFDGILKVNEEPYKDGCEQVFNHNSGIKVILRTACGFASPLKLVPEIEDDILEIDDHSRVIYSDGSIYTGWLPKENIIRNCGESPRKPYCGNVVNDPKVGCGGPGRGACSKIEKVVNCSSGCIRMVSNGKPLIIEK